MCVIFELAMAVNGSFDSAGVVLPELELQLLQVMVVVVLTLWLIVWPF